MKKTSLYARKRMHRPPSDSLAGMRVLDNCKPYEEGEAMSAHMLTNESLIRLKQGTAQSDDFDRVAMALNVAQVRALQIDEGLATVINKAHDAMNEVRKRYMQIERWGFTKPQLDAVIEALDVHQVIHDASSPMQMQRALTVVHKSIMTQLRGHT